MDRSLHKTRASDGQALLLAVLIMIAILLVGTLFVAVVNYNKRASGRHAQLLTAMSLAEAGIAHANEMLQFSPPGLDWRPSPPPHQYTDGTVDPDFWGDDLVQYTDDDYYSDQEIMNGWYALVDVGTGALVRRGFTRYPQMGAGHFLLRVTYDPDPPYEPWQEDDPAYNIDPLTAQRDLYSKYIKIEAIGVTEDEGFVSRKVQAYKPVALANYLLFVSDKSRRGYPTILGYNPWIDMDKSGALDFFSPEFAGIPTTYTYNGPMRFNTNVQFTGANSGGGLVGASNKILLADAPGPPITGQDFSNPLWGGYLRDDYFTTHGQVTDELWESTGQICAAFDIVGLGLDDLDSDRVWEQVNRLSAPDLFAKDPATGTMRWDALTREAGVVVTSGPAAPLPNQTLNAAQLGYMWDSAGNNQIAGLYIDNKDDIQFPQTNGRSNISKLMEDWLHNLPTSDSQYADSGWQDATSTGETYAYAPAVEIELFPSETETVRDPYDTLDGTYDVVQDPSPGSAGFTLDSTYDADGVEIWWPNHFIGGGEPGIRITRGADDGGIVPGQWVIGEPAAIDRIGEPISRTMYVDYPAGGRAVIFAEGNVRIKGRLPQGNYHLTVVSGGTIYIDGQILSPQDQYGRDWDGLQGTGVKDEDNTYIALLARDCVVVNPTMLVPQQNADGAVAQSDDLGTGLNKHWNLPQAPAGANVQASFALGHIAHLGAGDEIRLVAYQRMDSIAGTKLTQLVTAGDPVIYVEDASIFIVGTVLQATAPNTDALALGTIAAGGITGNTITLADPAGAQNPFPAGSYVDDSASPPTTGINLPVYNSSTDTWNYYDFDQDGGASTIDAANIFWLTREPRDPDERHIWEAQSPWCPLQKIDPLVPADIWWPWLLWGNGGATDWLGLTYAGVPNYVWFLMPDLAAEGIANPQDYWLKKFKLQEFAGGQATGTIHAKINAVMYAQDGCFFVIPGRYFKEDVITGEAREYLRYNYDVEIRGAITENFHPGPAVVREWQEKWAYPTPPGSPTPWNSIRYIYDETLLAARIQPVTTLNGATLRRYCPPASTGPSLDLVKVPLLPASPDLLYYGEVP